MGGRRILTIRKEGLEFPHCEVLPMSHDDADYDFDEDIDIGENATKKSSYVLDDQLVKDHDVMGSVAKKCVMAILCTGEFQPFLMKKPPEPSVTYIALVVLDIAVVAARLVTDAGTATFIRASAGIQ